MAIGTIGGLLIGGAMSLGGAALSSGAAKSASRDAAAASDRAAELAAQVQREIYGNNQQTLQPFINTGTSAMGQINALLGIPNTAPATTGTTGGTTGGTTNALTGFTLPAGYGTGSVALGDGSGQSFYGANPANGANVGGLLTVNHNLTPQQAAANGVNAPAGVNWTNYINSQPDVAYDYTLHSGMSPEEYGAWHWERDGARRDLNPFIATTATTDPATGTTPTVTQPSAQDAFNTYKNSTGYQFRLNQGMDAINSGYAGRGVLQSGAAMQAINDYGQNMASAEFSNYLGQLGNQQALGLSGASALAGVGQNYANSLGNIYQNQGANQANAALAAGQGGMQFGNALAGLGGQILGSAMNPWSFGWGR
jgi:hypothetical protein